MPGVSIGPGLMALTRMPRPASSAAQVRAKLRSAALGYLPQPGELTDARVGHHDVQPSAVRLDFLEKPVEIIELRHIALDADGPFADGFHGRVQLGLVPAGEVDGGSFGREPAGDGQTDSGRATGHQGDLVV